MSIKCSERIPVDKFNHFHEILCITDGRYISNPVIIGNFVSVDYIAGDYKKD